MVVSKFVRPPSAFRITLADLHLADFGSAIDMSKRKLKKTESNLGTLGSKAPEIGMTEYCPFAGDIYALGSESHLFLLITLLTTV